ncbi:hypothetical protein ACHAXA_007475 [Cyclostephanos tholiformis]|uniref:Cell division protein FtsZ n=1 Tax=Cyclostephanos tholiformis TaxID=382380 RepID=A0ABD3RSI9_9STRA
MALSRTLTGIPRRIIRRSRIEHATSSSWEPSRQQDQRLLLWQQWQRRETLFPGGRWQQQQRRHQSDHLKRRAIDALKSKNSDNSAVKEVNDRGPSSTPPPAFTTASIPSEADVSPARPPLSVTKTSTDPIATSAAAPPAPPLGYGDDEDANSNERRGTKTAVVDDDAPIETESHPRPTTTRTIDDDDDDDHTKRHIVDANPWAHMHLHEFAPKIVVIGVGGAGTNAVNNMVASGLAGVEFLALNTDAQHLSTSLSPNRLQIGAQLTSGLGCGANPDAGRLAAEESRDAIQSCIEDAHMVFITAGMGGGTGTGAAPVVAGLCYDLGILTVSVVTTPFRFEGTHRRRLATEGVDRLREVSDTLIVVPNQNLFRLVGEKTSFVESFKLADNVLLAGVRSITDLMTSPGLINLDFADVQSVMHGMGNALLGTGQACNDVDAIVNPGVGKTDSAEGGTVIDGASGRSVSVDEDGDGNLDCRAIRAAKMALNNPLLGEGKMDVGSAKGMLVNITGGADMTLFEVDRAAEYITERVRDPDANIIFGSAYDSNLTGCLRVSVVATGIDEE